MKLTTIQQNKIKKYVKILGISVMAIYISFGIFAYSVMDQDKLDGIWNSVSDQIDIRFQEVFADQSSEGHNYIVSISDGIAATENLK